MKRLTGNKRKNVIHYSKMVLATGALAALITACGGGNSPVATNKPQETTSATNAPAQGVKPEELPKALLEGKYVEIYNQSSGDFKQQVSEADFVTICTDLFKGIASFEVASVMKLNGGDYHSWISDSGKLGLTAVFDDDGVITAIQGSELTAWPETDNKQTKNVYDWPLKGDWFVFWGGKNTLVNYHYAHESQRYAYDIIQTKDHYSYKGDPLKNESYYAFGQPVYAPADGTVVAVVNDIPDNEPVGVMNEKVPAGNEVVIDHGGEYSVIAHLKKGTVKVKVGDKVVRGDELGKLGNSGNSSEAHLHYQVSDGADLFTSHALNINWKDGISPVQGETVTVD